jgi:predicted Mrr-cat superfamily restriction endonuclease
MSDNAYILRISPGGVDKVPEALQSNEIIIGWAYAKGLLDNSLSWEKFREIIFQEYHSEDENYRRAGSATGNMWRFIREMKTDDYILVPYHNSQFYIAKVDCDKAYYKDEKVEEDTAYRRSVTWLNNKKPYTRRKAYSKMQSKMKSQSTCVEAKDILPEIHSFIERQEKGVESDFNSDLLEILRSDILNQIRTGVMNERDFERLINNLLMSSGASNVEIREYRPHDYGADVIADMNFGKFFSYKLAVQCKYYEPDPPVGKEAVDQLIQGMISEGAEFGWLVTSGSIDQSLYEYVLNKLAENVSNDAHSLLKIELIDGDQLASMILENGVTDLKSS